MLMIIYSPMRKGTFKTIKIADWKAGAEPLWSATYNFYIAKIIYREMSDGEISKDLGVIGLVRKI